MDSRQVEDDLECAQSHKRYESSEGIADGQRSVSRAEPGGEEEDDDQEAEPDETWWGQQDRVQEGERG